MATPGRAPYGRGFFLVVAVAVAVSATVTVLGGLARNVHTIATGRRLDDRFTSLADAVSILRVVRRVAGGDSMGIVRAGTIRVI